MSFFDNVADVTERRGEHETSAFVLNCKKQGSGDLWQHLGVTQCIFFFISSHKDWVLNRFIVFVGKNLTEVNCILLYKKYTRITFQSLGIQKEKLPGFYWDPLSTQQQPIDRYFYILPWQRVNQDLLSWKAFRMRPVRVPCMQTVRFQNETLFCLNALLSFDSSLK